jgi:hypothetical protein
MRNEAPRITNLQQIRRKLVGLLLLGVLVPSCLGQAQTPPDDFPHFVVPGHEPEMESLRNMFWKHYQGAGPGATLWDEWIPTPTLWPAVSTDAHMVEIRDVWGRALSSRILDNEGYVATHQHPSIAHPLGWPFPFWSQGAGGIGWHFSFRETVGPPWRPETLSDVKGWELSGASNLGMTADGWQLQLDGTGARVLTPEHVIDTFDSPFLQLRWKAIGLANAHPFIEWATESESGFSESRRMYFDPADPGAITLTVIPLYKNPQWTGKVTRLRISFDNPPASTVVIQALFTQYDTRQNVNNASFIDGCISYFNWTGNVEFLQSNIARIRAALTYLMTEQHGREYKAIKTTWVGHNGRSGITFVDGKKVLVSGQGIGDNYWDLLPFGNLDAYASLRYYGALRAVATLEHEIHAHPKWRIDPPDRLMTADRLEAHAEDVKREGNRLFWDPATQRFVACIDAAGQKHDYGYTFLNLEAITYGYADEHHAQKILEWIEGERIIGSDTSTGTDIYRWRFAPRASTRRNIDWYIWSWSDPESIPWGDQVQDGGAVLGWSYHDVISRLRLLGPEDAWNRLREIAFWYAEVAAAGGYRKYYDGSRPGHLQGSGTPGGLGVDREFTESILLPQTLLDGFMGFQPKPDGFAIWPRLPKEWPEFSIDQIHWHGLVLAIHATRKSVEITRSGPPDAVEVSIAGRKPVIWSGDGPLRAAL